MGLKGKEAVTVLREQEIGVDTYGNAVIDYTENIIKGCLIAWGASTLNDTLFQTRSDTVATIYFPKGTDVDVNDKFIVRDQKFEANGQPIGWVTQVGSPVGTKIIQEVKYVTG